MAQTFTSTDVVSTTHVFSDNQSQRVNENTLRSTFSGSTPPSDPVVGQQWYDTANSKTMQYNGTAWVPVDTNGTTQVDVSNAKGSLTSLTSYLRMAHNDDGTLKTPPASSIDEFKDNSLVITYVSATSFRVPLDLTGIFTANRKLKIYLSASTVITYVSSSTYDSGNNWTVVTTGESVLDPSVTTVKYSIVQYGERKDTVHISDINVKRNTSYAVGDIAYSVNLKSYLRLECVLSGTTANTEPTWPTSAGIMILDGGVKWIIDDVRDSHLVGEVVSSLYLPDGYIKANGATVNRADYPRLVALATKYGLWTSDTASNLGLFGTGNGATTMVLPNWSGKMAQFAVTAGGTVAAGLPNITGRIGKTWIDVWTLPTNNGYLGAIQLGPIDSNVTAIPPTMSGGTANLPYYDNFDASWSNAIYGASTTVQPPAINVIPCMKY